MTHQDLSDIGQQVALMLQHIEKTLHAEGWGNTPSMIYRIDADPKIEDIGIGKIEYFSASGIELKGLFGPSPETELTKIVEVFEAVSQHPWLYGAIKALTDDTVQRPVAHLFITEAWHTTEFTSKEEFVETGIPMRHLSHAKKARYVIGITDKDCLIMYRPHGGEPRWLAPELFDTPQADVRQLMERLHTAEVRNWMRLKAPNN